MFDKVLLERLENKDARTQDILSQYLAQIITQTSKHDASGLSRSLQSVISPAIAKEIADNKDTMIDALYPIMGGMISKYVTQAIKEMMETINKKIEDGLSMDRVKRKVKAKVSGVSETELLLEESGDAHILSMFVIHKETSLLISEAHLVDQKIDDAHMVASMASAIKDFINDWIENNETNNEVQLLSYGNATLYIESAGSVFIVAFLDSEPDHGLRKEINTFFGALLKNYADFFQEYDGDDSAEEIGTLAGQMSEYLNSQDIVEEKKKEKSNTAKYILYMLALFLMGYGVYLLSGWYKNYSLESEVYAKTGEEIVVEEKNSTLVLNGQVDSMDDISQIMSIAKTHSDMSIDNHLLVPMTYLDKRFNNKGNLDKHKVDMDTKLESLEQNMTNMIKENQRLLKQLKQSNDYLESLSKNKTHEIMLFKEEKKSLKEVFEIKQTIDKRLDSAFKGNVFYDVNEQALDFRNLSLFRAGSVAHKKEAIISFSKTFEKYIAVLAEYKEYMDAIVIEGHSDSSGLEEDNVALSRKRASSIKHFVEKLESVKQNNLQSLLHIKAYGSSQAIVSPAGIEDKEKSRRIKIKFKLSDDKIVTKLGSMLND